MLITGKLLTDLMINAMTRSIPSIIALTLMCFTISYGILHFPDAGILDAAQSSASTAQPQNVTVMKQTSDGSALQQSDAAESTVLPGIQSTSEEAFNTHTTTSPEKEASASKQDAVSGSRDDAASKSDSKKNADSDKKNSSKKAKSNPKKERSQDNKTPSDAAGTSELKSEPKKDQLEHDDALSAVVIPDNDIRDNSLPIEVDQDPMIFVDQVDPEIPEIQVPSNASEIEQKQEAEPKLEPEPKLETDSTLDIGFDEDEKTAEDCWNEFVNSNKDSEKEAASSKDNSQTDSTTQSEAVKTPDASNAPLTIKTDPNAKEIPPRVREKKPANQDALTLPALEDQPNPTPKSNQSDENTIPLETFPLDDVPPVTVSYTTEVQQEPYDSFGFNIPAMGQIIVRRLPPVENSVDPIYNNAQLDRFAL